VPVEATLTLRFLPLLYSVIFFLNQGSFCKILAYNLMRYCICSPYCWPYVWFEHPGHTFGCLGSVLRTGVWHQSTPPPRPWPQSVPPPSSSSSHPCATLGHCHTAAIDLNPASLRARCCRRPRPNLPQSVPPPSSSSSPRHNPWRKWHPSPPSLPLPFGEIWKTIAPYVTVCVNVNEFDSIRLISLLIVVDFMEFSDSLVNFSGF
jgi:hypothetical protein